MDVLGHGSCCVEDTVVLSCDLNLQLLARRRHAVTPFESRSVPMCPALKAAATLGAHPPHLSLPDCLQQLLYAGRLINVHLAAATAIATFDHHTAAARCNAAAAAAAMAAGTTFLLLFGCTRLVSLSTAQHSSCWCRKRHASQLPLEEEALDVGQTAGCFHRLCKHSAVCAAWPGAQIHIHLLNKLGLHVDHHLQVGSGQDRATVDSTLTLLKLVGTSSMYPSLVC